MNANERLLREYVRHSLTYRDTNSQLNEISFEDVKSGAKKVWDISNTVEHIMLDIAGFIPGAGEFADAKNAFKYALEGEWLNAAFSLISCIPELGDIIGKGGKVALWLKKMGKTGALVEKAGAKLVEFAKLIKKHKGKIQKVIEVAEKNEKLKEFMDKIKSALNEFVEDTLSKFKDKTKKNKDDEETSQAATAQKNQLQMR